MGNVQARDHGYPDDNADRHNGGGGGGLDLGTIAARVTRVHVTGLVRTKDDMVVATIEPVLKVKQFQELVMAVQVAKGRLQELGCFKDVEIEIDTSKEGGAKDYEVTFAVQELRRVTGSMTTMVGNQEGSLTGGVKLPNLLGRGEKFQIDYTQGTKKTNQFNASLSKPIFASSYDVIGNEEESEKSKTSAAASSPLLATLTSSLYQQMSESVPSSYRETGRGALLDLAFLSAPQVSHNLQAEAVWRQLACLNTASAFAVRQHCGHTLKTSLKHILTVDRRDNPLFPVEGSFLRLSQEFAGIGGDIGFFKNELEVQANLPLLGLSKLFGGEPCVLQSTFHAGHTKLMEGGDGSGSGGGGGKTVTLSDHFYLGGPLNVRGFDTRGLGPSSEGNALGGMAYWATGLHLYTPLPFRSGSSSGFGDLFRTHSFVNAGNLLPCFVYNADRGISHNMDEAIRNFRLSYGFGLALKFGGIARIELNYCLPVRAQKGDKIAPGLQLGVGVSFL